MFDDFVDAYENYRDKPDEPDHVVISRKLAEENPDAILFTGLEEALIGIGRQQFAVLAMYDWDKCIHIFMREGMTYDEAVEYMEFNVEGAWLGEYTPIIINRHELMP
jgi:hypothetical protein